MKNRAIRVKNGEFILLAQGWIIVGFVCCLVLLYFGLALPTGDALVMCSS